MPLFDDRAIDGYLLLRPDLHDDMARPEIVLGRDAAAAPFTLAAGQHAKALRIEDLHRVIGRSELARDDQQIDPAAFQHLVRIAGKWADEQLESRCLGGKSRCQPCQKIRRDRIRCGHGHAPLQLLRRDVGRAHDGGFYPAQDLLQFHLQRPRPIRQHHAAADADEQIVVEILAQARQGIAGRRLREIQLFRGARDMSFAQHHVKRYQKVEIKPAKPHGPSLTQEVSFARQP